MKIAVISDDETTISQHFGKASQYVVFTIEDGKVVNQETRPKVGHKHFSAAEGSAAHGERHGYDAGAEVKHRSMAESIADCEVLLVGGMGWGAYESMMNYNIQPVVTDVDNIDKAVQLYLSGNLPNLRELLH